MRQLLTIIVVVLIATTVHSQSKTGYVTGVIKDVEQKPVQSATVSLLNAKDSSVAKLAVSDKQGNFEFDKLADGKYLVSITSAGLAKSISRYLIFLL